MRGLHRWLSALALLAVQFAPAQADVLLLQNVNILPLDSPRVIAGQSVVIQAGRIAALGRAETLRVPAGAEIIDARGAFLLPGLSDMHAHISGYADAYSESSGTTSVAENQLLLYLATGVTLLRDVAGSEQHFAVQERLRSGKWLGPDLVFTGPVLEGERNVWEFSTRLLDPQDAERFVSELAQRGYWGVKTYHTLSSPVFDAVMAAARRHSLPVVGHVPFEVGIDRALAAGMLSIEHLRGYDFDGMRAEQLFADGGRSAERFLSLVRMSDARMDELVQQTVANAVWNCPTLAIARFLFDEEARRALAEHARYATVHPNLRASVEQASSLDAIFAPEAKDALQAAFPRSLDLVRRLHEAGAGLLIGTDAVLPAWVPGFTPIDEMQLFSSVGIPNYEVLRMATVNAARVLGLESERGTVAVGKLASLILVDGNPLEDLSALWRLQGVVHGGRWLSRAELESQLQRQAAQFPSSD